MGSALIHAVIFYCLHGDGIKRNSGLQAQSKRLLVFILKRCFIIALIGIDFKIIPNFCIKTFHLLNVTLCSFFSLLFLLKSLFNSGPGKTWFKK